MKRQYVRWSIIAGLLLTGSYGGYQGYQFVAGGSEPTEVDPNAIVKEDPNRPKLIADPDKNISVANKLLSSPKGIVESEAPIVRANNEDNEYNPSSNFNPSNAFRPVGTEDGDHDGNAGRVYPRTPRGIIGEEEEALTGFPDNALRNGNTTNPGSETLGAPGQFRAENNAPLAGPNSPLGPDLPIGIRAENPGVQQKAPIEQGLGARQDFATQQDLPIQSGLRLQPGLQEQQPSPNQTNLGIQNAAPITSAPIETYGAGPTAPVNNGNGFHLAPLTPQRNLPGNLNSKAAGNDGIYNPSVPPTVLPNNGYNPAQAQVEQYRDPNSPLPGAASYGPPANLGTPAGSYGSSTGRGVPGSRNLEGPQSPQIVLQKRAPDEIQVNVPATFEIIVRNVGTVDATDVVVTDEVPEGTQFDEASPAAEQAGGSVSWQLGTLKPGDERLLSMVVTPVREGEIGSVARVQFQATATARTTCTKPLLKVTQTAQQTVLAGEYVTFNITINNPGTGAAYDVILEADVPEGLSHQAGSALKHALGTLPPGATRELQLKLLAEKAGLITNQIRVRGKGKVTAVDAIELEVIAPELTLALDGPSRRYLNRDATYTFSVYNPGTAPAKDVELVSYLPKGFKFKEADKQGHYDPRKHAVYWSLTQLPPEQKGLVSLTVVPVETGNHKVRAETRAQQNLSASHEHEVLVSALAELKLTIADSADPIELGKDTVYEIRVTNTGSKDATNVRLVATLPVGMQAVGADGPTREQIDGQNVHFQELTRLATDSSTVYRIQAKGIGVGDQRIKVQVVCEDSQTPTLYEEVTRVYQD